MSRTLVVDIVKWAACAFVCLGAYCTSYRIDPLNIYFLNVGSLLYLAWGYLIKEWNQVVVNAFLFGLYMIGLWERLA